MKSLNPLEKLAFGGGFILLSFAVPLFLHFTTPTTPGPATNKFHVTITDRNNNETVAYDCSDVAIANNGDIYETLFVTVNGTQLEFSTRHFIHRIEQIPQVEAPKPEPKVARSVLILQGCKRFAEGLLLIGGSILILLYASTVCANACDRLKKQRNW